MVKETICRDGLVKQAFRAAHWAASEESARMPLAMEEMTSLSVEPSGLRDTMRVMASKGS